MRRLFTALLLVGVGVPSSAHSTDPIEQAFSELKLPSHPIAGKPAPASQPLLGYNKHEKLAHMYITWKAYQLFNARYPGSELGQYIGDYVQDQPPLHTEGTVIEGSYDEDIAHEDPWDDLVPVVKHFWNWRGGYYAGLYGADSSVNRAHKYFSGGYGIEGRYDRDWDGNEGPRRGVKDHGIAYLYRHGEKATAYWYLGHVAHLLEDLTVPAHEHLWPHANPGTDAYEAYMATNYPRWGNGSSEAIEIFPSLYQIFLETAKVSEEFDAGFGPGDEEGIDGTVDRGARRRDKFTPKDLDAEADVLMPLAFDKVASLFRYFFKTVDVEPPKVELRLRREGNAVVLTAHAAAISGIDRLGYRFEYRPSPTADASRWKTLTPSANGPCFTFRPVPGISYAFRATAESGAGRIGISSPVIYAPSLIASR